MKSELKFHISTTKMSRKRRIAEGEYKQKNDIDNDYSYDVVGEVPPTRDRLYASYETLNCATERDCIPCAYKIGCL